MRGAWLRAVVGVVAVAVVGGIAAGQTKPKQPVKPRAPDLSKVRVLKGVPQDRKDAPAIEVPRTPAPRTALPAKTVDDLRKAVAAALEVEASSLPAEAKEGSLAEPGTTVVLSPATGLVRERVVLSVHNAEEVGDDAEWRGPEEMAFVKLYTYRPQAEMSDNAGYVLDCAFLGGDALEYEVNSTISGSSSQWLQDRVTVRAVIFDGKQHVLVPFVMPANHFMAFVSVRTPALREGQHIAFESCEVTRWR